MKPKNYRVFSNVAQPVEKEKPTKTITAKQSIGLSNKIDAYKPSTSVKSTASNAVPAQRKKSRSPKCFGRSVTQPARGKHDTCKKVMDVPHESS